MFSDKKAIIFDLDGTLIDSLGIWNLVDEILLRELNGPNLSSQELCNFREQALIRHAKTENPYVAFCGDLGRLCQCSLTGKAIHRRRYEISRKLLRTHVHLQPKAVDVIDIFKKLGMRLVIATTTKQANIDIYAQPDHDIGSQLNFDSTFEFILSRENITHIKPDPEIFNLALKKLNLKPEECLVFEDSLAGVTAARAAGIDTVTLKEKWSLKDEKKLREVSTYYCEDFDEVLAYLTSHKNT